MHRKIIPDSLYKDEVVRLLADRYRTDSTAVVRSFLMQSMRLPTTDNEMPEIRLEENEMKLLEDLLAYMNRQKNGTD